MKEIGKSILSLMLSVIMVLGMTTPSFATTKGDLEVEDQAIGEIQEPDTPSSEHLTWNYSRTAPKGIKYSSSATVKTGDTRLSQTLDNITVGMLAGSIVLLVPINPLAQVAAGAIIASLPVAFRGSTTLYYRIYTYQGAGNYKHFHKKCIVYYYYDKKRTKLAYKATYYGTKG